MKGKRFSRLVVIKQAANGNHNHLRWLVRCDCGVEKIVIGKHLRLGKIRSCGCYRKEKSSLNGKKAKTHGHSINYKQTKTYQSWVSMKSRCLDKRNKNYKRYKDKKIKICDRWKNSFENFLKDMGERPEGTTLDRVDNDGNYEKSNCKWVDRKTQARNRSTTKLTMNDVIKIRASYLINKELHKKIAVRYGVTPTTIGSVLNNKTWR